MRLGFSGHCCPDPAQIAAYAREVHPEVMFGVPRVWEKVYAGVNAALAADPDKKQKFDEAVAAAMPIMAAERRRARPPRSSRRPGTSSTPWPSPPSASLVGLDALVVGITGAAPIPRQILEWFNAIGVPLTRDLRHERDHRADDLGARPTIKPGHVGPAIPGCEVRIADDGEVICRGGNVFQGYFKEPDKTAETLDRRLAALRRHRRDGRRRLPARSSTARRS